MNKTPMNNGDHDWLDKMLSGNDDYINDGGFTERVMNGLPARRRPSRVRALIFGCTALISLACFLLSVPGLAELYVACLDFFRTQPLYDQAALALVLYTSTGGLAWWIIDRGS